MSRATLAAARWRARTLARWLGGPDRGSAIVEFLGVSLLLLVPVLYLVLTLSRVQAAAFAAEGAAREAGRIVAQAASLAEATARAERAVELAFADQGFDVDGAGALVATCAADPCLTPGAVVQVEVGIAVALPLLPSFLDAAVPAEVPVTATHLAVVGEFREAP
ncbi:pilus assembly protein [Georgenia sp. SYP-B2076]|uniref:pilus assembly protein n=1 Tax=Georgenia sp. SYP-B2076 TaxID=2495881 RepID=UPI0013E02AB3|nr:pilus assembly protein [Georgenia sp. SYP-B2076]